MRWVLRQEKKGSCEIPGSQRLVSGALEGVERSTGWVHHVFLGLGCVGSGAWVVGPVDGFRIIFGHGACSTHLEGSGDYRHC